MAKHVSEILGRYYRSKAIGSPEFHEYCEKIWPLLSLDEKKVLYRFLYAAKQWNLYLLLVEKDIVERHDLDWPTLVEILFQNRKIQSQKVVKNLFKLAKSEGKTEEFLKNHLSDKLWPDLRLYRRDFFDQRKSNRVLLKDNLLMEYRFAKSQRLANKQSEMLNKLLRYFPADEDIKLEISNAKLEKAKRIIERKEVKNSIDPRASKYSLFPMTEDEKTVAKKTFDQVEVFLRTNPKAAADFAIMMLMLDQPKYVLHIARSYSENIPSWLRLDLLMKAQQYIEAIGLCEQLKHQKLDSPDSFFAIHYNQSLAYWHLGKKDLAVDIMKNLVSVRPSYRSAAMLLMDWTGSRSE